MSYWPIPDYEKDPEMVQMAPFQPYAPPTSPITPPATPEPLLSSPPSAHEITMTALKSCVNARLNPTVPKVQASQAFIRPVPQVPSIIRQDSGVMRPVSIGKSKFLCFLAKIWISKINYVNGGSSILRNHPNSGSNEWQCIFILYVCIFIVFKVVFIQRNIYTLDKYRYLTCKKW